MRTARRVVAWFIALNGQPAGITADGHIGGQPKPEGRGGHFPINERSFDCDCELLACDGSAHHAITAHRLCAVPATSCACSSDRLMTARGCPCG